MDYRDLKRNGSGYYDMTAYLAIKIAEKENKDTMNEYCAGDIVIVDTTNGPKEYLILKEFEGYATSLMLRNTEPDENGFKVMSRRGMMWTDAGRLGYIFYDKITDYVKSLSNDELKAVCDRVGNCLGLIEKSAHEAVLESIASPNTDIDDNIALDISVRVCDYLDKRKGAYEQLIKAEAERDVYKGLYLQTVGIGGNE